MPQPHRRRALLLATASALVTGVFAAAPAHAGTCDAADDSADCDYTVTATDGTTIQVRVIKPNTTGTFPAVIIKGGTGANRCSNMDFASRQQLAAAGYVVIGMTTRGMPGRQEANGYNEAGTYVGGDCPGNNDAADLADSVNDSGSDWYGPTDVSDVSNVVDWAKTYSNGGVVVDSAKIGFVGHSHDAGLAYFLANQDPDVKAVVSVLGLAMGLKGDNIAQVSNKPTAAAVGHSMNFTPFAIGASLNYDPGVIEAMNRWARARYLRKTPDTTTTNWMNARTAVDDNSSVDIAHSITTPFFVTHGWMDKNISPENAIQAFNKLPTGNKYLYLGACNGHSSPCATNNASYLRGKVIGFLDKYLKSGASIGGPIFNAVPPTNTASDSWTVAESTSTTYPPSATTYSLDLPLCASGTICGSPTGSDTVTSPQRLSALVDYCTATAGGSVATLSSEYKTYTSSEFDADTKTLSVEADLWVQSTTDRMQVSMTVQDVAPDGTVTSLARTAQELVVPVSYGVAANTPVHFVFRPMTRAWTFAGKVAGVAGTGHKLRVTIASNAKPFFAVEPDNATYTIQHNATYPSKVVLKYTT
jgi:predicted acyl esterase